MMFVRRDEPINHLRKERGIIRCHPVFEFFGDAVCIRIGKQLQRESGRLAVDIVAVRLSLHRCRGKRIYRFTKQDLEQKPLFRKNRAKINRQKPRFSAADWAMTSVSLFRFLYDRDLTLLTPINLCWDIFAGRLTANGADVVAGFHITAFAPHKRSPPSKMI